MNVGLGISSEILHSDVDTQYSTIYEHIYIYTFISLLRKFMTGKSVVSGRNQEIVTFSKIRGERFR
jgi:hypothetical protein